ncbi:hypothetical protein SUGI_0223880 [Cryptomeria japonica]|nr:hypothetical protein SUGI_0223880 [Cryptomeria japonica]
MQGWLKPRCCHFSSKCTLQVPLPSLPPTTSVGYEASEWLGLLGLPYAALGVSTLVLQVVSMDKSSPLGPTTSIVWLELGTRIPLVVDGYGLVGHVSTLSPMGHISTLGPMGPKVHYAFGPVGIVDHGVISRKLVFTSSERSDIWFSYCFSYLAIGAGQEAAFTGEPTKQMEMYHCLLRNGKVLLLDIGHESSKPPQVLERKLNPSEQEHKKHSGLSDLAFSSGDKFRAIWTGSWMHE